MTQSRIGFNTGTAAANHKRSLRGISSSDTTFLLIFCYVSRFMNESNVNTDQWSQFYENTDPISDVSM